MAWAAKRSANEPLIGLFIGPLTALYYSLFVTGPLLVFEICFNFHLSFKCDLRFIKE